MKGVERVLPNPAFVDVQDAVVADRCIVLHSDAVCARDKRFLAVKQATPMPLVQDVASLHNQRLHDNANRRVEMRARCGMVYIGRSTKSGSVLGTLSIVPMKNPFLHEEDALLAISEVIERL